MAQRERIQNLLVDTARSGTFYPVTYGNEQKAVLGGTPVSPAEALANETSASFGQAEMNRRSRVDDKTAWSWELRLGFHQEVNLEAFEAVLLSRPLILARDTVLGYRQVELRVSSVSYQHPPTQGPRGGTKAVYTFQARQAPV